MGQNFFKGRTNNHLTWVMVDSTDFASPESALSAATKIKIYGKTRGATTVALVSSGAGSLTNDILHVGASALGIYTIALVKADLSDASAAWYDQYIISLSATGAAYQTLVIDGGIDMSALSKMQSTLSDLQSYLAVMSGIQSDVYSLLSDHHSDFQSRVPKLVATNSQLSDLHSDLKSYLAVMSDVQSDFYSDFQSRVPKAVATNSQLSDLHSDLKSYLTVMSGIQSDVYSLLSDHHSDFQSRVPKLVANNSQVSDLVSDLRSLLIVHQSQISDIQSNVQVLTSAFIGHTGSTASQVTDASVLEIDGIDHDDQFNGYYIKLLGGSQVDELRLIVDTDKTSSKLTVKPAFLSRVASGIDFVIVVGDPVASKFQSDAMSRMSDVGSDIKSYLAVMSDVLSDFYSDFQSRVPKAVATNSQLSDLHSDLKSYLTVMSGIQSDVYSLLSDHHSDFQSRVPKLVATNSQVSDLSSDVKSAVQAITVSISASDVSDIASAVLAGLTGLTASDLSNIASAVWADVIGARVDSRVLVNQSYLSDIRSHLSDIQSDFQSRVPKRVATDSQLSDLHSDLKSYLVVMSGAQSDIYSLLSDHHSDFQSRVPKLVATNSQVSDLASDIKSAVGTINATLSASDISDIASAVWANAIGARVDSRVLVNQSYLSDIRSHLSDIQSDFQSRVPKRVATDSQLSDLHSDLKSYLGVMSGVQSDIYSLLSDVSSDVGVMSGVQSDMYSLMQAGPELGASSMSDLRSAIIANGVLRTGIEPLNVPAATAALADKVDWLNALATHRIEQTSVLQTVKDIAQTGTVASAAVSDDGTTFVRDSFA